MVVTTSELGKIMGVTHQTIYQWRKQGCPSEKRGEGTNSGHVFDTREVIKWRDKRTLRQAAEKDEDALTKEEAQRRKLSAEAAMQELELARKRGDVVELREIELKLSDEFAQLRSSLRKIPERCVLRLVGETDERRVKKIILEEVDSALELLVDE